MNCPKCYNPMIIVGNHWVCGEHEEVVSVPAEMTSRVESQEQWLAEVTAEYPFPLAVTYQRLQDDVVACPSDGDALRQLIRLKDCMETLVKYLALVAISARLDRQDTTDALDRQILEKLVAPSLGTWVQGILQPLIRAPSTRDDPRLASLVDFASGEFFARMGEFTSLRNRVLGHGLVRDPREDRHDLNQWLPRLNQWLEDARFLADWKLVEVSDPLRSWMGAEAESKIWSPHIDPTSLREVAIRPGEFLLVPSDGRPISLYPFIYLLICPRCQGAGRLFVYDSQNHFSKARQEANMVEHTAGHKCPFDEPGKALAERFDQDMLLEYYRKYRRNFEVLDGKLTEFDFDTYRQRVRGFVGRRPLLDAIAAFVAGQPIETPDDTSGPFDRGYFLLLAEAGIGKTAVLTHWIDHNTVCGEPIRFFWRRGRDLSALDFLRHTYHGLLRKHNIEDQDPPEEEHDYPRKLDSLLKLISERYLGEGEREVIVIDGLDEAGDSLARQRAMGAIPRELPANVYFLLSSRPVRELDGFDGQRRQCFRHTIDPDSDWNRKDVREYIERELSALLKTEKISSSLLPFIEEASEGNFLWAEQFCLCVRGGKLPVDSIAESLPRMQGLDELYREFWSRVIASLAEKSEQRLWRVVGVLSVACTALSSAQICRFAGIEDDEWIVVRSHLQQYLDEVELPNDQDPESPLIGFRIYHASFRDYLLRQSGLVPKQHHEQIVRAYLSTCEEGENPAESVNCNTWDRYGIAFVPHHAIQAELWDDLERLLTDIFFLEAKTSAEMVFDLADDFTAALAALPQGRPRRHILELLAEALRRNIHFIARHADGYPQALFQSIWNHCWWHGYDDRNGQGSLQVGSEGGDLYRLLKDWLQSKESVTPGFSWLRLQTVPAIDEQACLTTLRKHTLAVTDCVAPSPEVLISASYDGTLVQWALGGSMHGDILGTADSGIATCDISQDGRWIVCGCRDGRVRILNVKNRTWTLCEGEFDKKDTMHDIWRIRCCPDGQHSISVAGSRAIVHHIETGHKVKEFAAGAFGCAISSTGLLALAGPNLQIRDANTLETVKVIDTPFQSVAFCCDFSSCGRYLLFGGVASLHVPDKKPYGMSQLWDANTWQPVPGHDHCPLSMVKACAFSGDGNSYLLGLSNGELQICDVQQEEKVRTIRAHGNSITSLVPVGPQRFVSASADGVLKIWDAAALSSSKEGSDPPGPACYCAFSQDAKSGFAWSEKQPEAHRPIMHQIEHECLDKVTWKTKEPESLFWQTEDLGKYIESHRDTLAFPIDASDFVSSPVHGTSPFGWPGTYWFMAHPQRHGEAVVSLLPALKPPTFCKQWCISRDGTQAASFGNGFYLWHPGQKKPVARVRSDDVDVRALGFTANLFMFSRDGKTLYCGQDKNLFHVDVESLLLKKLHEAEKYSMVAISESQCGEELLLACSDGVIRILPVGTKGNIEEYPGHRGSVTDGAFVTDHEFVSIGQDGTVRWWRRPDGMVSCFQFDVPLTAFAVHAETRQILIAGHHGKTGVLRLEGTWEGRLPAQTDRCTPTITDWSSTPAPLLHELPTHPDVPRPILTKVDGFTTTTVEVQLNEGFGSMHCCNQFYQECQQHSRRILIGKNDDADSLREAKNILVLLSMAAQRGSKLYLSVAGTDSKAEHILLRLVSALTGSDSYQLDFEYFD